MERIVRENKETIAAVIVEPLCQGAAGIHIYPKPYLRKLRALCDACDVLLIADEIAVGFGRTGSMFACEEAGIVPDIMCLGKALTAGYLPMSAAVASDKVFGAFCRPDSHPRIFFDGHTYCGNPITAATALATLDVMAEAGIPASCKPRYAQLAEGMRRIGELPHVRYQKCLGLIGMCEIDDTARARRISLKANELGLFIRPLGPSLYLWPPLTSTEEELGAMIDILAISIAEG